MDFERPVMTRRLQVDAAPGLAELIRGEATLDDVVQPLADGISVITAGAANGAAAALVADLAGSDLLKEAQQRFDILVVDLPPILGSSFGRLTASFFDSIVLVVRAGITPVGQIREAITELPREPVVLLNGTTSPLPRWVRKLTYT
jgi:non-specific protein-tyrosine kinase